MERIFMYLLMPFYHLSSTFSVSRYEECFSSTYFITVEMNTVINIVNKKFLSMGLDAGMLCDKEAWEGFNISSPQLLTLSKALSPSFLRFGGNSADYILFNDTFASPQISINKQGFHCDNDTRLTVKDWIKLNDYTNKVGWKLIFGLNAMLRDKGRWNPSNAKELFKVNSELGYHPDWELGNELNIHNRLQGEQLGKDFVQLRKILDSFHYNSSLLVGPDVTGRKFYRFLLQFLNQSKGVIDAITFHHYYFNGRTATLEDFLNVKYFDELKPIIRDVFKATNETKAKQKVWLGETSTAWGGGAPGLSDRYVAGFLWLDKLGISAVHGIDVVMKQSLYYGHYALLTDNLHPAPTYWVSLLYKRLVGREVFHVHVTPHDRKMRVYAHCVQKQGLYNTSDGITIYAINLNNSSVKFAVPKLSASRIHQYLLTPTGKRGLKSRYVTLNDQELKMNNTELPSIIPKVMASNSTLVLPPFTYGFYVFPDAVVTICSKKYITWNKIATI